MAELKILAELNANVWKIAVAVGDSLELEDEVIILEAMKTEIPVTTTRAGTVRQILVAEGDAVQEGQALMIVGD